MKKMKCILLALCLMFTLLNLNDVHAATKEVDYVLEYGKTLTIKDIKSIPSKVSGDTIKINKVTNGIKVKALKKEGLSTFKSNGKTYNILVLKNNIPSSEYNSKKIKIKKTNGVFYVTRESRTNSFITLYNSNKNSVDVTFKRSEYKDNNTLFETREQSIKALAPNETYTLFTYTCMPIHKDSIKVNKKSYYEGINTKSIKLETDLSRKEVTNVNIINETNCPVFVNALIIKLDKNGNMVATGGFSETFVPDNSSVLYSDKNYTSDISKSIILDYHVYTSID